MCIEFLIETDHVRPRLHHHATLQVLVAHSPRCMLHKHPPWWQLVGNGAAETEWIGLVCEIRLVVVLCTPRFLHQHTFALPYTLASARSGRFGRHRLDLAFVGVYGFRLIFGAMLLVLVLNWTAGSSGFLSAGLGVGARHPLLTRPTQPLMMARWTRQDMKSRVVRLPPRVEQLLADETPRDQVGRMWGAFRACYSSEADALDAVERNPEVILPYLNSPGNIAGNYRILLDVLGKESARDVCARNPGVLGNNPKALVRSSAQDIVKAADLVEFVANIPFGKNRTTRETKRRTKTPTAER